MQLRTQTRRPPRAALWLILLALPWWQGCSQELPDRYPVMGTLLVDGQPAEGAQIRLVRNDEFDDAPPVPYAITKADGSFVLSTFLFEDGAPVGEYQVTVFWPSVTRNEFGEQVEGPDRLGGRYAQAEDSGLQITVAAHSNHLEPLKLSAQ